MSSIARAVIVSAALLAAGGGAVMADDGDHDLARRLLEQGRIQPLAKIVEMVRAKVSGEVLSVEFENENGAYVYELKILRPDGKLQEVEADAASGAIRQIEDDD